MSDGQVIGEALVGGKNAHLEAIHEEVGKELTGGAGAASNYEFDYKKALTPDDIDENFWRAQYASMSTEELLKAADEMHAALSGMAAWTSTRSGDTEKVRAKDSITA